MPDIRKDSVTRVTITDAEQDQRIDNYLLRVLKGVPKSHVYRILRSGEVRVNKGRIDASYRLQLGDEVRIPPVRIAAPDAPRAVPALEFPIVYEDDALLVINKPAGVAVHGGSGVSFGVIEQLRAARPEARFLELVHRLDRETSGLLLIAKKRPALVKLHAMMRDNHNLDKRYLALGCGDWAHNRHDVKLPLLKYTLPDGERRVRAAATEAEGQYAHTRFRVLSRHDNSAFVLVEAQLKTGRTHQIRVHMAANGATIAGDDKSGGHTANRELLKRGLKRMFLHAWQLKLSHPLTDAPLVLQAPLPPDLQRFLDTLAP